MAPIVYFTQVKFVVVDIETTGGRPSGNDITEIGIVHVQNKKIIHQWSSLIKPDYSIPNNIQALTGISDEMVQGKVINDAEVAAWFEDDPLIIAHNAAFDRQMFERRFQQLNHLRWACTFREIDWRAMGYSNAKLDFLLYSVGYFYQGHRAWIDSVATAWLLHRHPQALAQLLKNAESQTCIVQATGSPFAAKEILKARRYWWDSKARFWHTQVHQQALDEELAFLDSIPGYDSSQANIIVQDARSRFQASQ